MSCTMYIHTHALFLNAAAPCPFTRGPILVCTMDASDALLDCAAVVVAVVVVVRQSALQRGPGVGYREEQ